MVPRETGGRDTGVVRLTRRMAKGVCIYYLAPPLMGFVGGVCASVMLLAVWGYELYFMLRENALPRHKPFSMHSGNPHQLGSLGTISYNMSFDNAHDQGHSLDHDEAIPHCRHARIEAV